MSRKIDRALRGPSITEVVLGALLSLILGIVIAAVLLIFRPVIVVKQMPKEEAIDRESVYFVEGSRDTGRARDLLAKRKSFMEGRSISLMEDELNAMVGPSSFGPAPAGGQAQESSANETIAAGTPNFRVRDGALQVGMPVTVNLLGLNRKIVVQARGAFEKQGPMFIYNPDELYVGSLPLQRLPALAHYIRDRFMNPNDLPEDLKAAWMKLENVTVDGNVLNLTMP